MWYNNYPNQIHNHNHNSIIYNNAVNPNIRPRLENMNMETLWEGKHVNIYNIDDDIIIKSKNLNKFSF